MRRIVWTDEALAHLEAVVIYTEAFNPLAAQRMALRLVSSAESLVDHPNRGRAIDHGERELVVISPYIIRYRVDENDVVILHIRHGARLPFEK